MLTVSPDQRVSTRSPVRDRFIACSYTNESSNLEILRIDNVPGWNFEKAVFPEQQLIFETPSSGELEIYSCEFGNATLCDRLSCEHLQLSKAG